MNETKIADLLSPEHLEAANLFVEIIPSELKQQALHVIYVEFPKAVAEIQEYRKHDTQTPFSKHKTDILAYAAIGSAHHDSPRNRGSSSDEIIISYGCAHSETTTAGPFPQNAVIVSGVVRLHQELVKCYGRLQTIYAWLCASIPEVSEGHNTGVDVLHAVIRQVENHMEWTTTRMGQLHDIFTRRAESATACLNSPGVQDRVNSLAMRDMFIEETMVMRLDSIIQIYQTTGVIITRNLRRVLNPRGDIPQPMY